MIVTKGSTNVTTYIDMRLSADGTEATGLTPANFDLTYVRSGAAPATKVDASALASTGAAHSDNGVIEIDSTNLPGLYRVDWPDAAFATGVDEVVLGVKCATAFTEKLRVTLTDFDLQDAVRGGMTALPNANAEASGGLFTRGTGAGQINQSNNGRIDSDVLSLAAAVITATSIAANAITAAKIATDSIGASELATDAVNEIRDAILSDSTPFPGASITEARLAELAAANLPADIAANAAAIAALNDPTAAAIASQILTTTLADAYAANGVAPTLQQAVMAVHQFLMDFAISGTSYNVNKVDGTAAFSGVLDDATNPTSHTR